MLATLLPNTNVTWLNQTHSNNVIQLDKQNIYNNDPCDASFTLESNAICAVLTADCLPIFLTNINEDFVSAIHAGWQGVANGIISNTINTIGLDPTQMKAFIGPSITQPSFQVGDELKTIFCELDSDNVQFFINDTTGKTRYLCDIRGIAVLQLLKLGLQRQNIYWSDDCTYQNTNLFYSYRKEPVTGRFASLIWLAN